MKKIIILIMAAIVAVTAFTMSYSWSPTALTPAPAAFSAKRAVVS